MDKKQLSEIDICEKFISPVIARAGWNIHDQIFRADYALFYKSNIPIAVVEAKDNNKAMAQVLVEHESTATF